MTTVGRRWWSGETDWTLRRQLIALFIVFTVGPLLVTNVDGYLQSRRTFERTALRHSHDVAALEASATFRFVHEQYQLVAAVVAGNQDLFGLLRALATPDPEARDSVLNALRTELAAKQQEGHAIEELYILSPSGQFIVSTLPGSEHPGDQSESPCFRRGLQLESIDGVDWSGAAPALLLSAPIHDTAGTFLGVFCARTGIQLGYEQGDTSLRDPSPTTVYLVERHGRIIARDPDGTAGPLPGTTLPLLDRAWTFGQESWEGSYGDTEHGALSAYAPIIELGWGIVVETPTRMALASLDRLMWEAGAFVLILTALAVAAAIIVARRISQPVTALSAAARSAASGALGRNVSPGGTVEVRDLALSFNLMSAAVKESHDLLEHRIAERTHELQASQEFSVRLLDSIAEPVVVIDRTLVVVQANQAALRRYGDNVVGSPYHAHFACAGDPCTSCPVEATFASGTPGTIECRERLGEVDDIVSLSTFAVRAGTPEVEAVIQLRRVVTRERELQAQMVHQEKLSAFGIMAAGVAHEIGNPLAAVQSQLALARTAPVPGRIEQTLDIVGHEIDRIARLLHELVSFGRGHHDVHTLVSLDQVARDVVRLIRHGPRAQGVEMEVVTQGGPAPVRAKEDSLVQVIINLGLNALDAMPDGGKLTFEAGSADGRVILRVRDTGQGVSESARPHLFEPFFTTKGPGRGTGLGLFVSRGIVEGMDGDIVLEDTGPDGTVFRVSLPLAVGWQDGGPS